MLFDYYRCMYTNLFIETAFYESGNFIMSKYFEMEKEVLVSWDLFAESFCVVLFENVPNGFDISSPNTLQSKKEKLKRKRVQSDVHGSDKSLFSISMSSISAPRFETFSKTSPRPKKESPSSSSSSNKLTARFRVFAKKRKGGSASPRSHSGFSVRELQLTWNQIQPYIDDIIPQLTSSLRCSALFDNLPEEFFGKYYIHIFKLIN